MNANDSNEIDQVETSVVKRDTSKLSRRDKLELVLSEAPELPALLGEVRAQMSTLTESVQPLVSNVTADLGASKDGLVYLRTRQQLLLAYCMNVCFYMILKVTLFLPCMYDPPPPGSCPHSDSFRLPRACLLACSVFQAWLYACLDVLDANDSCSAASTTLERRYCVGLHSASKASCCGCSLVLFSSLVR